MLQPALARFPAALAMSAACLAACSGGDPEDVPVASSGTTTVAATHSTSEPASEPATVPHGFGRTAARVTAADGEVCELCVWVADTPRLRARGLMEVTDLGNADAMAFIYPGPTTASFWMKDTPLRLSIAFFAEHGSYLDALDMEPCTANPCPSYPTAPDFTVAVEVPQGRLDDFLMSPGATLELLDLPCDTLTDT